MPSNAERNKKYFAQKNPAPKETVILVHGTWANSESTSPPWWDPRSDFVKDLDAALAANGSIARCWAPLPFRIERPEVFAWTGDNSQSQRHSASLALAELIEWLEKPTGMRYHIVAHSHGGNVVLGALNALAQNPRQLGAVVFLGTPVLKFSSASRLLLRVQRYGPSAAIAVGLVASLGGLIAGGSALRVVMLVLVAIFALTWFAEFARLVKDPVPKRKRSSLYGDGQPYAYTFDSDEAIAGLTRTVDAMKKPRELIEKLMPVNSARKYILEPWVQNEGIDILNTWPVLTLKGMRHTWQGREGHWAALAFMPVVALVSVIGVVPYLLIFGYEASGRLWTSLTSKFRRWLLNHPGASVMGRVVTGAAVGADQGRFECISSLPPGVEAREVVTEELQTRMRATTRAALASAGESLGARVFGLSYEDLTAKVAESDASVQLAHSQYYREPEIVQGIAKLICANGWGDIPQFPRPEDRKQD